MQPYAILWATGALLVCTVPVCAQPTPTSKVPLAFYESNLTTIVQKVRAAGATPVFITTNYLVEGDPKDTTKNYYYHRHDPAFYANVGGAQKWLDRYIDAMRAVAKKLDVPVADVRRACDEYDPKQ